MESQSSERATKWMDSSAVAASSVRRPPRSTSCATCEPTRGYAASPAQAHAAETQGCVAASKVFVASYGLKLRSIHGKADRIRVLDRVVASLDADAARDAAWEAVAAQRDAEAERDPSVLLPMDEVLAKLRAELQ
jgi:hypothetical protein